MELAIQTEHLTKIYAGRVIAVNDMSLNVPSGAVYGLLGPNGAGKTTTLRLLLGLQRPSAGNAKVFGHPCGPNATNVRAMIGYLPTHPVLPGHLCPIEYLDLLGKLCRIPQQIRKPRLTSLLRAVGLLSATDRRIQTFSTGMRTRLGIAASLLADPPLLVWDEPTAGLDPSARRFTLDLIRELAKSRTVMVATHILSDIDQICDHVGVMHEGRMIFSGSMREMKQRLQRDDFCLELDGDPEDVRQLAEQAAQVQGIKIQPHEQNTVLVEVADGHSRAGVMAEVLRLVDASKLTLQAIRSTQNETEFAYLQLLQQDSDHGFRRFDLQSPLKEHAVTSDSGV
ncbi:Daunorubicin/doxorubicin resistance ATP-binding protein DrrA [Planctomycetes bacterium CA13]|uniref:Daunorubicin/doxorubicin resistance ATP-binding protein DrrA n=1 Tax=Novipirellula herctigrandis TaxID=2527986 RepID=A0A5C5YYY9_9BACT|nr:Daunorubicin/doxorubicin resistance ATP-binding protein DrrA [Planctomycetes bacterium CA13]